MANQKQAAETMEFGDPMNTAKQVLGAMGMDKADEEFSLKALDHLSKGGVVADLYNLTKEDLEVIYSFALNYYKNEKYDDAVQLFRYLCMNDHLTQKWWLGLGAAQQKATDYAGAVRSYTMATMLDVEDPRPPLHGGYCLMMLGDNEKAVSAFEHVAMVCESKPEHAALKQQAQMLLGVVKNDKAGK